MNTLSYEQLSEVNDKVSRLVTGYYIQQMNPIVALETGQGNCLTSAMIAAAHIQETYELEASAIWNPRLHGTVKQQSGVALSAENRIKRNTTNLNIHHIELLVPRSSDEFDVLSLGYGLNTSEGDTFTKEERGGEIKNYNFMLLPPEDADISHRDQTDEPYVHVIDDSGLIVTTKHGREAGMAAGDWYTTGIDYLAAVNVPAFDHDELIEKTACFMAAMLTD